MSELLILDKNSMLLTLDELKNAQTGAFQNGASVAAQVKDVAGGNIGDPITMSYVTGSEGKYQGTIPDDIAVQLEVQYKIEIVATVGSLKATFRPPVSVVERTEIG